jgi:hypothetical protein
MRLAYSSEKQLPAQHNPAADGCAAPWSVARASAVFRVNRSTATAAAGLGTILFGIMNSF